MEDPTLEEAEGQTVRFALIKCESMKMSTPFGGLAEPGSAVHVADSVQPEYWVILIPHGSLRWDEKGWDSHFQLHVSNREMSVGCGKLEWQNITLLCISNEDTGYDESVYII